MITSTKQLLSYLILLLVAGITFGTTNYAKAQSTYYDAIALAEAFEASRKNEFYTLLGNYTNVPYRGHSSDVNVIESRLQQNGNSILLAYSNLFRDRLNKPNQMFGSSALSALAAIPAGREGYPGSSSGGIGWSSIADGLSKFVVGRVKEEVIITFFERLRQDFKRKPELELFFPTTRQFIDVVEDNSIALIIEVLRQAFQKDISELPNNLPKLAALPKYQRLINNHPPLRTTVATAAALSFLVENRQHPAKVMDKLGELPYLKNNKNDGINRAFSTLSFISKSLRDPSNEAGSWITQEQLNYLETVPSAPSLFMGLNLQKYGQEINGLPIDPNTLSVSKNHFDWAFNPYNQVINVKDVVNAYMVAVGPNVTPVTDSTTYSTYYVFKPYFQNFLELAGNLNNNIEQLKTATKEGQNFEFNDYMRYTESFVDMLTMGVENATFGAANATPAYLKIAPTLLDLRRAVDSKEYGAAIVYLNVILLQAIPGNLEVKDDILRYGLFMANVANAQTSEEVQQAIEAIALPTGSATIKKKTQYNISLNTYAGPYLGQEFIFNHPVGPTEQWSGSGGIYAPLGIAFSKGFGDFGSLSLYTTIVDIGALVNFRFNDPYANHLPEFKLENILAPGAYVIYGLPQIPVSAGFGVQYGPQLREINVNGIITESAAYRMSGFIGVDIPILNFYTVQ